MGTPFAKGMAGTNATRIANLPDLLPRDKPPGQRRDRKE